ncbi:MAG: glycosyltransferase family 4 protein [Acidobacteriota bacterium]
MKILHVVHAYPPSLGGSQWLMRQLSRGLVEQHGDEVSVFTTVARHTEHFIRDDGDALPATTERLDGLTVRRFRVWNGWTRPRMLLASLSFRWRLPFNEHCRTLLNGPIIPGLTRAVATSGADVVMATAFPLMHMYAAQRGARRAGIPIVFLGALHVADAWNYDREMIFRAIRAADAYIAHTEFEHAHVLARGADPDRLRIIGGGVDVERFAGVDGVEMRRRLELGSAPVVLMLSKHVARKRFDVLIHAMRRVWEHAPEAQLVLAGGATPYTAEIEAMLDELGAGRRANVRLVRDVEEADKPALLAAADLFVLPSALDSFGIVLAEAWACSRPVIGVDSGAIGSLIADGDDGLHVPYENAEAMAAAILRLVEDPALRRRMGQAGRAKAQRNFDWPIVTRQVREVYEQAIRSRGAAAQG